MYGNVTTKSPVQLSYTNKNLKKKRGQQTFSVKDQVLLVSGSSSKKCLPSKHEALSSNSSAAKK
jgi:hypothetical protein